jgi:hypothetical protein
VAPVGSVVDSSTLILLPIFHYSTSLEVLSHSDKTVQAKCFPRFTVTKFWGKTENENNAAYSSDNSTTYS